MHAKNTRDLMLPGFDRLEQAVSITRLAEDLGYGFVTMGETTGHNVPLVMSVLAERTERIGITDNVLSPFSRTPTLLGQTAITLQEISDGRFRLRLGASSPALAENWHGVEFDRPLRRLRESIDIIRQVQSGDRLDYDGECYTPDGLKISCPAPESPAPVDVAALGPKSTEMTGRFADGWVPQLLPIAGLEDRLEDLRRGAEMGGRDPDEIRVAHSLRCMADEDGDVAREKARSYVAFMISIYGPYYRGAIAEAGWGDLTETVSSRWKNGDREGAADAVTDDLLDELVAAGTPAEARKQVSRFESIDGVNAIQIGFFGGMNRNEQERTLKELAPE